MSISVATGNASWSSGVRRCWSRYTRFLSTDHGLDEIDSRDPSALRTLWYSSSSLRRSEGFTSATDLFSPFHPPPALMPPAVSPPSVTPDSDHSHLFLQRANCPFDVIFLPTLADLCTPSTSSPDRTLPSIYLADLYFSPTSTISALLVSASICVFRIITKIRKTRIFYIQVLLNTLFGHTFPFFFFFSLFVCMFR